MVDLNIPVQELEYFLLIFARIATFVFIAPFFSTRGVPNMAKIGLSVFTAYVMYTSIQSHVYPEYNTVFGYSVIVLKEVAVGLLLGLGASLCTSIVLFAGRIMDTEIGLSMSSVFDPTTNQETTNTGMLLNYGTLLVLYTSGMHRYLLQALMETFTLIPINGAVFDTDALLQTMIDFLSDYITIGFRIVLPVFAVMMLLNVVLGLLAKLAPQMNMFSVGIQLKLLVGLCVLSITITMLPDISEFIYEETRKMMVKMVEAMM